MTRLRLAGRQTFRSLEIRNFRIYLAGQIVSGSGSWMQQVAQAWLVLKLTNSPIALGFTTALQFLPVLLLGPWGGVVADRMPKRRLLLVTQMCFGFLALLTVGTWSAVRSAASPKLPRRSTAHARGSFRGLPTRPAG